MAELNSARIVVPAELETLAPSIMAIANAIEGELADLRNLLLPLREFWSGNANIGWQDLQTRWDSAANDLMSSMGTLGGISQATLMNWNNYVDAETANMRTWAH